MTNTLQPISSDAEGHSNEMGNSSVGVGMAALTKKLDSDQSEINRYGIKNTENTADSALVASYIEELNN